MKQQHCQIYPTELPDIANTVARSSILLTLHSATIFRVKNNPETAYSGSDRFLRADSEFGVEIEIL